jgi:serine/threonine-protein kinase
MQIGSYILTEKIGNGTYGIVYKGHNEKIPNENLAIKVISNTGNLDTLLVEPELLSQLAHPNIISLKDYFIDSNRLVLVTEYVDGRDLQSYINQRKNLSEDEVLNFLVQMADALAYAHKRNIIHRDIKPSNILVTVQGEETRFILADFGVGRIAQGIQTVKHVAGTYHYMAPEQLRGRPCEQSDLWALGVCSYTLLTDNKPFEGSTVDELYKKVLLSTPKLISKIPIKVDHELEKVIFNLLEKDLKNRISSADILVRNLKTLKGSSFQKIISKINYRKITVQKSTFTWEENDATELKKSWIIMIIFLLLGILDVSMPELLLSLISLLGVIMFYLGQVNYSSLQTIAGICILLVNTFLIPNIVSSIPYTYQVSIWGFLFQKLDSNFIETIILSILWIIHVFGFLVIGHFFSKAKRLKENLIIHKLLRESLTERKRVISVLKRFIDVNWTNINIIQKYIELLLLDRRIKEAIVEAELALRVDPYNFGVNLLLAYAYLEADMYDECIKICDAYLAISNYCFEFNALKKYCNSGK